MVTFSNSFQDGMTIFRVNRLIYNSENIDIDDFFEKMSKYFKINEEKSMRDAVDKLKATPIMMDKTQNLKNHVFCMQCNLNDKSYFLKLKDISILDKYYEKKTDIFKKLDVNILHKIVFDKILGIHEEDQYKGDKV